MHNSQIKASTQHLLINSAPNQGLTIRSGYRKTARHLESMIQKFAGQFYKQISSELLSVRAPVFIDFWLYWLSSNFYKDKWIYMALCDVEAEIFIGVLLLQIWICGLINFCQIDDHCPKNESLVLF